jgi:hypothetical protein
VAVDNLLITLREYFSKRKKVLLIGKAYAATNTTVAVFHNGNGEFTTIFMHENVAQNMELLKKII